MKAELARESNGLVEGWNTRELRNGDVLRAGAPHLLIAVRQRRTQRVPQLCELGQAVDQPVLIDGGRPADIGKPVLARSSSSCPTSNNNTTTVPFSPIR
jgi:hypothetical protein